MQFTNGNLVLPTKFPFFVESIPIIYCRVFGFTPLFALSEQ